MNELARFELREHVDGQWSQPGITLERWLSDPNEGARLVPMRAKATL